MEEVKKGERSHSKTRNHIKNIHKQIRQGTFIKNKIHGTRDKPSIRAKQAC